ncbi:MAG: hypothetical protein HY320_13780 [Armatimonadetes bacterium]|nr:hypothetical protein [Armatimonadota bacterium]
MSQTVKQAVLEMIERMPGDVTIEEIMYELYFRQHVDRGLRDLEEGHTVSHEEVEKDLEQWLKSGGR